MLPLNNGPMLSAINTHHVWDSHNTAQHKRSQRSFHSPANTYGQSPASCPYRNPHMILCCDEAHEGTLMRQLRSFAWLHERILNVLKCWRPLQAGFLEVNPEAILGMAAGGHFRRASSRSVMRPSHSLRSLALSRFSSVTCACSAASSPCSCAFTPANLSFSALNVRRRRRSSSASSSLVYT
jgi:hypothetical protein